MAEQSNRSSPSTRRAGPRGDGVGCPSIRVSQQHDRRSRAAAGTRRRVGGAGSLSRRRELSDEEQRIRALGSPRDPERAALLQRTGRALAQPEEVPLASREVDVALASVMARRERRPRRGSAPSPGRDPAPQRVPALQLAADALALAQLRACALPPRCCSSPASASSGARRGQPTAPCPPARSADGVEPTDTAGQVDTVKLADGSTVVLGRRSRLAPGRRASAACARARRSRARRTSRSCTTTRGRSSCGPRARRCATSGRPSPSTATPSAARASR